VEIYGRVRRAVLVEGQSQRSVAREFGLARDLADVLRAKLIGRAVEVSAEVLDTMQVQADGRIGEVAAPQLLKHDLT